MPAFKEDINWQSTLYELGVCFAGGANFADRYSLNRIAFSDHSAR